MEKTTHRLNLLTWKFSRRHLQENRVCRLDGIQCDNHGRGRIAARKYIANGGDIKFRLSDRNSFGKGFNWVMESPE